MILTTSCIYAIETSWYVSQFTFVIIMNGSLWVPITSSLIYRFLEQDITQLQIVDPQCLKIKLNTIQFYHLFIDCHLTRPKYWDISSYGTRKSQIYEHTKYVYLRLNYSEHQTFSCYNRHLFQGVRQNRKVFSLVLTKLHKSTSVLDEYPE